MTFGYPGAEEPVLREITFEARPGETTAIVGSTGTGKTTLVNLLPRLYDVTAGAVLVDGVDVREVDRQELWSRIGMVPQKAYLFSGTVASNLRYGDADATDEQLWQALEVAQARDFVSELPEGLEAPIAQGGTNSPAASVSAWPSRGPSSSDRTSTSSTTASRRSTSAPTRACAPRLPGSSTRPRSSSWPSVSARSLNADRIVVLDDGAVVGLGNHGQLMETCQTYREIVLSQVTEEEAA